MRTRILFVAAVLAVVVVSLAPPATATGTTYSFNLVTPNTAENPSTGSTVRVTGAGTFDTTPAVRSASSCRTAPYLPAARGWRDGVFEFLVVRRAEQWAAGWSPFHHRDPVPRGRRTGYGSADDRHM